MGLSISHVIYIFEYHFLGLKSSTRPRKLFSHFFIFGCHFYFVGLFTFTEFLGEAKLRNFYGAAEISKQHVLVHLMPFKLFTCAYLPLFSHPYMHGSSHQKHNSSFSFQVHMHIPIQNPKMS